MIRNKTDFFVHPESEDVIEATWANRSWHALGIKHMGGFGSRDKEEFATSLQELLQFGWIKLQSSPEVIQEKVK